MQKLSAHPRYAISLFGLLFCATFLIFNAGSPESYSLGNPNSVSRQLQQSEVWYRKKLIDRTALIRKWGPQPEDVVSFPTHGQFYTLWDFFTPEPSMCRHRIERVGILGDGGKWVCGLELIAAKKSCVIYSVGINGESSFEAALLERGSTCQVFGYDFSTKSMGPEIETVSELASRSHFWPYMLSDRDDHSSNPPRWTLGEMMKKNGHTWIDILKIDVEGAEFGALDALLEAYPEASKSTSHILESEGSTLPFGQLQLEIHAGNGFKFNTFLEWWVGLERAGLRPFWTEPNLVYANIGKRQPDLAEYSFINLKGNHELIRD